jgi:hypothetical protein
MQRMLHGEKRRLISALAILHMADQLGPRYRIGEGRLPVKDFDGK